jgi:hypothetical protein
MASITVWQRLEGLARDPTLRRGLQAQIRDPLWLLARQWQVGEFHAHDGGSPTQVTFNLTACPLTGYHPGLDSQPADQLDPALPLEVQVEREPVQLGVRGAVQLGLHFETLAAAAGASPEDLRRYRTLFPIRADPPAGELPDPQATAFRLLAAGRVTDGTALYDAIGTGRPPLPPSSIDLSSTLDAFAEFRQSLYSEPAGPPAWAERQLTYQFTIASDTPSGRAALHAPEFLGDRLGWEDFDPPPTPADQPSNDEAPLTETTVTALPQRLLIPAFPSDRWWAFEAGTLDMSRVGVELVDLSKLLVAEFALLHSCDWYWISAPLTTGPGRLDTLRTGTLSCIDTLVVTDSFGVQTLIRPTETMAPALDRPWSMFKLGDDPASAGWLLLPPQLDSVLDGPDLEEVLLTRDEVAGLAWAIEAHLPGPMDTPIDGLEAWRQRIPLSPAAGPPPDGAPAPIAYQLQSPVPDNQLPMVPVQAPSGALYFRRGRIAQPTPDLPAPTARGRILQPDRPLFVADQAIPPAGLRITRRFRRARCLDGSTAVWIARRVQAPDGPSPSGLRYDLVEPNIAPP